MNFRVGQKVSYPNHGICKIENIETQQVSEHSIEFYSLRILANNCVIRVPVDNVESVGVRPIINSLQCKTLMEFLAEDFDEPPNDWKTRTQEFNTKIQTGCIFQMADVLKKLTFLAHSKKLSFREQRIFEKSKFLIVSELAVVCSQAECRIETKIEELLNRSCERHGLEKVRVASAVVH